MKRGTKIWLIIALILALLGGVLCVSAFAMGVTYKDLDGMARDGLFSFNTWWDDDVIETEYRVTISEENMISAADYTKLIVDLDGGELTIQSTDSDQAYLETDSEKCFELQMKDSVIKVTGECSLIHSNSKAVLYIPKDFALEHVFLDIDAGSCVIETPLNIQTLEVDVDAGNAEIQNMTANWLNMDVDAGSIIYEGTAASGGEADVDAGQIQLTILGKNETDYNYDIEVDAGTLEMNGQIFNKMNHEEYIRNGADASWSLSCDAGKIVMKVTP